MNTASQPTPLMPRIRVCGNQLMAGERPIRLRGTNLGNWQLQEDFMLGLYGTHTQMRQAFQTVLGHDKAHAFWDTYEQVYFTDQDAAFLQQQGFNLLRVPLSQNRLEDPNAPGHYDEQALQRLDALIQVCKARGIYVMLDLHAVAGGQSREIYADSVSAHPDFWRYADFRQRATDLWVALAQRYQHESAVAGYDLINEPHTEGHTALLTDWLRATLTAIRRVDADHVIWLSGDDYGTRLKGLTSDLWNDPQTAFQFHIYPSFTYPVSKMTQWPQVVDGVSYDPAWLRHHLREPIDCGRDHPVFLGEFGMSFGLGSEPVLQQMVRGMVDLADEENWSWSQWSYKDLGQMGLVSPAPSTPWKQFLATPEVQALRDKANTLFAVKGASTPTADLLAHVVADLGAQLGEQFVPRRPLLFARRPFDGVLSQAILHRLITLDEASLRQLAQSFAFEACEANSTLLHVFKLRAT